MFFLKKSETKKTSALFLLLAAAVSFTSCKKFVISDPNVPTVANKGLKELVAPETFSWQPTKTITLKVTPLDVPTKETHALEIRGENNELLFIYQASMRKALNEKITVPYNSTKIKMKYGNIQKTIDIINSVADVDYSQPIPVEYQ